jgi:hypothetical protein
MKLDANAVATLAKVSDLIEQWHEEALDRYAWEVECHQRDEDKRVLIMARALPEQLEQCVAEMRALSGGRAMAMAMLRKVNNGELLPESPGSQGVRHHRSEAQSREQDHSDDAVESDHLLHGVS